MKLKIALLSLVVTLIFLQNYIFHLNQVPDILVHSDTGHVTITLRHYRDLLYGQSTSNLLTVPMFYGHTNSLLFSEPFFLHGFFSLIVFIFTSNVLVVFNILAILTLAASFFSMFLLAHYFTKSFWPSFLAAAIYTFNPFVMGRFPEHISYYSLQWLPLIFLFLEKSLVSPIRKHIFFFFVFISLQFLSSITFIALLSVVLPPYALLRWIKIKTPIRKYFNIGLLTGLLFLVLAVTPTLYLFQREFPQGIPGRDASNVLYFSVWAQDIIFPSKNNVLYHSLYTARHNQLTKLVHIVDQDVVERYLFTGITPLILLGLSSYIIVKKSPPPGRVWLIFIGVCFVLSFGPYLQFNFDPTIPLPYALLAKLNPLIAQLRAPSRFYFLFYLFFALTCALGLKHLPKISKPTYILLIGLIFLEYWTVPWKFTSIESETTAAYTKIANDTQRQVLLELPMGNLASNISFASDQFVETRYMLYASSIHNKTLFNGYSSYIPAEYSRHVNYITVNFPTKSKINTLKENGIDTIILHKNEFKNPQDFTSLNTKLKELNVPLIYSSPNIAIFSLTNAPL